MGQGDGREGSSFTPSDHEDISYLRIASVISSEPSPTNRSSFKRIAKRLERTATWPGKSLFIFSDQVTMPKFSCFVVPHVVASLLTRAVLADCAAVHSLTPATRRHVPPSLPRRSRAKLLAVLTISIAVLVEGIILLFFP